MYCSANWQLLEEHIDDDWSALSSTDDRHMQYIWGPRYIDDIIARLQNSNFGNDSPDITYEDVWYHLTDAQFSTVAIIDDNAALIERVSYDAYGKARHHRLADLNGDGATTTADSALLMAHIDGYGIGDLDRDGTVTTTDRSILSADLDAALPAGQLSTTDNIIGYAGYVFNAEHAGGGLYTVRFRVYAPDLGRWLTRDPLGYVDGMGLYEYVRGAPSFLADPLGLECDCDRSVDPEPRNPRFAGVKQVPTGFDPWYDEQLDEFLDDIGLFEDVIDWINLAKTLYDISKFRSIDDWLEWLAGQIPGKSIPKVDDETRRRVLHQFFSLRGLNGVDTYVRIVFEECTECDSRNWWQKLPHPLLGGCDADPNEGKWTKPVSYYPCKTAKDDIVDPQGTNVGPGEIVKCIQDALEGDPTDPHGTIGPKRRRGYVRHPKR